MKGINERIKEYRMKLHLSQDYVAKYLGVNRSTFSQIELGNRKVTAEEASKLCVLFGISADTLFYDKPIVSPSLVFARSFEKLDEADKNEIINLIRFKEMMRENKNK